MEPGQWLVWATRLKDRCFMEAEVKVRSRNEFFTVMWVFVAGLVCWVIADAIYYKDIFFIVWSLIYTGMGFFFFTFFYHDVVLTANKDAAEIKYGLLLFKKRKIEKSHIRTIVPTGKPARYFLRRLRSNVHNPRLASIHVYAGAFSDKCLLIVSDDGAVIISSANPDKLAGQLRELYDLQRTYQEVPEWVTAIVGELK
jgi:hypothetical protein